MDEFQDNDFWMQLPVYVVVRGPRASQTPGRYAIPTVAVLEDPSDRKMLPLFSDEDLASRFCQDNGLLDSQVKIAEFVDGREYLRFLERQYRIGIRHVALDPRGAGHKARTTDLDHLIGVIRQALEGG
jgi:hypothetical protein